MDTIDAQVMRQAAELVAEQAAHRPDSVIHTVTVELDGMSGGAKVACEGEDADGEDFVVIGTVR